MRCLAISLTIGLLGALAYLIYSHKAVSNNETLTELKMANEMMVSQLSAIETISVETFNSNSVKLNGELVLTSQDNTILTLNDLAKNANLFILRITEYDCNSCIEYYLEILYDIAELIGTNKAVVITSYKPVEVFKEFSKSVKQNVRVYNINNGDLGLPLEGSIKPFYLIIDKNLSTSNCYTPIMDMLGPGTTESYKELITRQFIAKR